MFNKYKVNFLYIRCQFCNQFVMLIKELILILVGRLVPNSPDTIFMFNYVQVGRFFGDIDPVLARKLFNTSVYSIEQEYDYQASCPVPNHTINAGPRSFYIVSTDHITRNYIFICSKA